MVTAWSSAVSAASASDGILYGALAYVFCAVVEFSRQALLLLLMLLMPFGVG